MVNKTYKVLGVCEAGWSYEVAEIMIQKQKVYSK